MRVCYRAENGHLYASEEFEIRNNCGQDLLDSLFGETSGVLTFLEGLSTLHQHRDICFPSELPAPRIFFFSCNAEIGSESELYWVKQFCC